jgi:hypothetical protein
MRFQWGSEKIRGVYIGGWLVLEPLVPSCCNPRLIKDLPNVDGLLPLSL